MDYCIEKEEKSEQNQTPRFRRAGTAQRGAPILYHARFSHRAVSARVSPRHYGRQSQPQYFQVLTACTPETPTLMITGIYGQIKVKWSRSSWDIELFFIIILQVRMTLAFALSKMAVFSFIGNYPISLSIRPGKFACHEYQRRSGSKTPCACYLNLRFLIRTLGEILSSIYHRIECIFSLFNEYEEFLLEFKSVVSFSVLHF